MRILVAEDDPRLAALLEQSLAEAGWAVDVRRWPRRVRCCFRRRRQLLRCVAVGLDVAGDGRGQRVGVCASLVSVRRF
jgi:DNA-binding response OmpR family regulator